MKSLESAKEKCDGFLLKLLKSLRLIEEKLVKVINNIVDEEQIENYTKKSDGLESDGELKVVSEELMAVTKLTKVAELKVNEYKESTKKKKRGLENNVLQKVGFESVRTKLDSCEGEREAVSLQISDHCSFICNCSYQASTVERIMKNLNIEITQLRRSLEDSRSNTERLQSLIEKQAQDIAENMLYIKELEDREKKLAQNVEELLMKIKETEAEFARLREACEEEVKAGKCEIEERDKVVAILNQELEKTKTALDMSNHKLNEEEELTSAAMSAQAAANKSLKLADNTAAGLCKGVEELSK
ncbi:hypothetical protein FEM48_Zijuj03G0157300 [Ziziphus jujuba var. spinosa]|uniref:Uncharacterized protein n=1 Tax=Ziziphus jujuba var. spinosa TaxID=714518 RepID=A0A978VR67_ZIZJJ|nr:hypothetical protein FEM48_Zijuj03G0157300 [Ziziphus jujuba var. spinosa]